MLGRILRVLFGLILAYLAAGLTLVLFVYTPTELVSSSGGAIGGRLSEAALLSLAVATYSALFSAPIALIAVVFAEVRGIGHWIYYLLAGIAIAAIGFFTQYWSEGAREASIINSYAASAFLVTGVVAGIVYWFFSGRYAAGPQRPVPAEEVAQPEAASTA